MQRKTARQLTVAVAVPAFYYFGWRAAGEAISPSSTANRQMVLAGFRLAKLLNNTLG